MNIKIVVLASAIGMLSMASAGRAQEMTGEVEPLAVEPVVVEEIPVEPASLDPAPGSPGDGELVMEDERPVGAIPGVTGDVIDLTSMPLGLPPDMLALADRRTANAGFMQRWGDALVDASPLENAQRSQRGIAEVENLVNVMQGGLKDVVAGKLVPKPVDAQAVVLDTVNQQVGGLLNTPLANAGFQQGMTRPSSYMGSTTNPPEWYRSAPSVTLPIDGRDVRVAMPAVPAGKSVEYHDVPRPGGGRGIEARSCGKTWDLQVQPQVLLPDSYSWIERK